MRKLWIAVLLLSQIGLSERVWEKPYQKWSAKEVNQLLTDSPWTRSTTLNLGDSLTPPDTNDPISRSITSRRSSEHVLPSNVSYRVQLRSAMPIRQAIARKLQLDASNDDASANPQTDLKAKIDQFLSQRFDDTVVLHVTYNSNVPSYLADLRRYWIRQNVEQLKSSVFLNVGGRKLELKSFLAAEGVFQLTFERSKDLDANSRFSVELQNPSFGTEPSQRIVVKFNPKEMTFNGALAF